MMLPSGEASMVASVSSLSPGFSTTVELGPAPMLCVWVQRQNFRRAPCSHLFSHFSAQTKEVIQVPSSSSCSEFCVCLRVCVACTARYATLSLSLI